KQKLEILKQLYLGRRFLVLDEPTSVLTPVEADEVLGEMRRLADAHELTVVLITHKLREVMQFAQDVTILRGGKVVAQNDVAAHTEAGLATLMFGETLSPAKSGTATKKASRHARAYLELDGLNVIGDRGTPAILDLGFNIHGGEIVGIAGVSGNGQKEL